MTTNIRNIMRRQQRELLTSSSNLLHTDVMLSSELPQIGQTPEKLSVKSPSPQKKTLSRPASSYVLTRKESEMKAEEDIKGRTLSKHLRHAILLIFYSH